jgi:hypothetical protein
MQYYTIVNADNYFKADAEGKLINFNWGNLFEALDGAVGEKGLVISTGRYAPSDPHLENADYEYVDLGQGRLEKGQLLLLERQVW